MYLVLNKVKSIFKAKVNQGGVGFHTDIDLSKMWFCFVLFLKMIFTDLEYETQYHSLFKSGEKVLCSERSQWVKKVREG